MATAQTWEQYVEWAIRNGRGRSHSASLFRMFFTKAIHAIWNERNLRIFEKRDREVESIVREIAYICNVRATPRIQMLLH